MKILYEIPEDIWPFVMAYFNCRVPDLVVRNGKHYVSQKWLDTYEKRIDNFILSEIGGEPNKDLFE